jgi:Kef-type K+ transport system membrane component KefB/mannitol/fructose-specific phosphotransferase system IIA component (Ntr-type)
MFQKISLLVVLMLSSVFASEGAHQESLVHTMTVLVFQLGAIIFMARLGGSLLKKIGLPSVLGELSAGILIGPYLLGSVALPGFAHGLFPLISNGGVPVSTELYGVATLASILLLFMAGLETDLSLFIRYSVAGTFVGLGGVIASFVLGAMSGVWFMGLSFFDPVALFLGVMSSATSVGITARVLSDRKKMESPEGVTILAGAVIDDVLGIIALAIVLGIAVGGSSGNVDWGAIEAIAVKAVAVWLVFTVAGLIFGRKISAILKKAGDSGVIAVLAFGMALIMAGFFEKAGLAMIIGAYITGLSLSRTDLSYVIQDKLHPVYLLLVPIFFTVMGMMVDVKVFASAEVFKFGLFYSLIAVAAKVIGSGVPAAFLNFNMLGALRVGLGMVPRGEVALIIAGIGMSSGIIDDTIFGVAIMMTLFTTIAGPPLLSLAVKGSKKGIKKDGQAVERESIYCDFPSAEVADLVGSRILVYFGEEGFFINKVGSEKGLYHIRKDDVFLSLVIEGGCLTFSFAVQDSLFVKTVVYESMVEFNGMLDVAKSSMEPNKLREQISAEKGAKPYKLLGNYAQLKSIVPSIESNTKQGVIEELVNALVKANKHLNKDTIFAEVMSRENALSTAFQNGIAIPHCRVGNLKDACIAFGLHREGVDFGSIDAKPTQIFFLLVSPKDKPEAHIQLLAGITGLLNEEQNRSQFLACHTKEEIYQLLIKLR